MYAVIDLETTGGRSSTDKIIEIAIILFDGEKVTERWSTLVHPECYIPGYITDITGIDNDMVAEAPRFYEVAKKVVEMLEDRIFVAHNVGFDYGFMQQEFASLGFPLEMSRLCTVRTARKVLPGHRSYSLGKLCAEIGIPLRDRHRALGDADATVKLLQVLLRKSPEMVRKMIKGNHALNLPPGIEADKVKQLPEKPGVFYLHNPEGQVIYLGKCRNLQKQVIRFLEKLASGGKKIPPQVTADVSWETTGSHLLTEILYLRELESLQPEYNHAARTKKMPIGIFTYPDQNGFLRMQFAKKSRTIKWEAEFPSETDAREALRQRLELFELCGNLTGLDPASGPCSHYPHGACRGACVGEENPETYNRRAEEALVGLGYPSPKFLILDKGRKITEVSAICVENGVCKGYGWLDQQISWDNPRDIIDALTPLEENLQYTSVIRTYLRTGDLGQIIAYS